MTCRAYDVKVDINTSIGASIQGYTKGTYSPVTPLSIIIQYLGPDMHVSLSHCIYDLFQYTYLLRLYVSWTIFRRQRILNKQDMQSLDRMTTKLHVPAELKRKSVRLSIFFVQDYQ